MKQLYFCRHGESELNRQGLFAGHTDTPLTEKGREQAKLEGERAKGHGIDLIVSSPLSRALDTARIIAGEIGYDPDKIIINDLLIERNFGDLEQTAYDPSMDPAGNPSVEQDTDIIARAQEAAKWLETLDATVILVVSHGSLGRALRYYYLPDIDYKLRIPNAEILRLK